MPHERSSQRKPAPSSNPAAQRKEAGFSPAPQSWDGTALCEVELYWKQGVCEHWLRFGKPVATTTNADNHRVERYAAGQTFALVRWASQYQGSILSRIDILQAAGPADAFTPLPDVRPGAKVLLSVRSWRKVSRVLGLIDAIEALGIDPCDMPAECWRDIQSRLRSAMIPQSCTPSSGHASLAQKTRAS